MRKTAIALAALALSVLPLRGQVPEGAPLTHDNVLYTTPVWSRDDPFALLYLSSRTNDIDSVAALGPRVTALEGALDGGTNNWNTAYGWGNHAGLYKAIGWVPSWTEVTGKPDLFDWNWDSLTNKPSTFPPSAHTHPYTDITDPPWLTSFTEQDEIALQALSDYAETNRVVRWWNSDGDIFVTLEDGVGSVWEVTSQTNTGYIVTGGENLEPFAVGQIYFFQSNVTNSTPPSLVHQITYTNENPNLQLVWIRFNPIGVQWLNGEWRLYSVVTPLYSKVGNWPLDFYTPLRSPTENPIYFADYSEVLLFTNLVSTFATSQEVASVLSGLGIHTNNDAIHLSTEQVDKIANAVTNEQDLAALRAYHYGSPDIVESPAEWFVFDGAGTITGFNNAAGRENVVIPWAIGGVPVTGIGGMAFYGTSLTSVTIPNSVTSIGGYAFESCYSLTSITIGNSVTSIGSGAFCGTSLTSVTIPNSVTSIGDYVFGSCYSLTSITIPNSVTSIGSGAFYTCSLTSITIPDSVTSIGSYAFGDCASLTSLYFDGNAPSIGPDIFLAIPANQVTNYVTNPTATGWGDELGGMPVVRMDLYGDKIYQGGELVATTQHVAQAIAGKVDAVSGLASNLWLQGETIVSDSYTNLWWRNVYSNGWHWLVAYTNAPGGDE